ncbi:hypothetical protein HMPREF1043_0310 [Streptococcus anginosus subsp. whileyi CCUG 39159]|uniref:Uncharacterized protein n=1 Tax=Streptococcus anginosus subsp. whileyi CCUG 39159 TaxID=1095729 RepID=I0SHA8_STRAP|nr:hypothetical protein HMPREF1043_0310 [Streptococcus anginosus subsp. whileyi CCUG 39159]
MITSRAQKSRKNNSIKEQVNDRNLTLLFSSFPISTIKNTSFYGKIGLIQE